MATYEYVVLIRENKTNWANIKHLSPRPEQTWTCDYHIWWPDAAEAETRLDKDSAEWSKICGDLGRQGWKLVIAEIPRSSVGPGPNGWAENTVSFPISERWYFERVVSS